MQTFSNQAVLILAAGNINNKFQSFQPMFNAPGLLAVNSKTALAYQLDFYQKNNISKIYIAINDEDFADVKNELVFYKNFELITIQHSETINHTLLQALEKIDAVDSLIVSVTTTIPVQLLQINSILLSSKVEKNKYYSTISSNDDNVNFFSKNKLSDKLGHPFCGVIHGGFQQILKAAQKSTSSSDFLDVAAELYSSNSYKFEYCEWIDIGHEINYFEASSKIFSSRAFNSLEFNIDDASISKKSTNVNKFINEINYFRLLPDALKIYFPRLLTDTQLVSNFAQVTMEYYSYPNLAEYLLYKRLDEFAWDRIFLKFEIVLTKFKSYKFSIGKNAYMDFYFNKTMERLELLGKHDFFETLMQQESIVVNGELLHGINILLPKIKTKIETFYNENDFSIMHGDFCFNNILYDFRGNILRLLDPRGSFGDSCIGIYGDVKYDLAKLSHSSCFHYDYIVNDLFELNENDGKFEYNFMLRDNQAYVNFLTENLIEKLGYKANDIFFIVGLLFISMVPLHADNFRRQKLMYLHGLKILNTFI